MAVRGRKKKGPSGPITDQLTDSQQNVSTDIYVANETLETGRVRRNTSKKQALGNCWAHLTSPMLIDLL